MRPIARLLIVPLGVALVLAGCSHGGAAKPRREYVPSRRGDMISIEEIRSRSWSDAYELVSSLRANWLNARGPGTIMGEPAEVQVHLNGVRLGAGAEALRSVALTGVAYVQYFDPITAASRWGIGYGRGCINIQTANAPPSK